VYRDTSEPIELPDFVQSVGEDAVEPLAAALAFAEASGIEVIMTNVHGARGSSSLGKVRLQQGDEAGKLLPVALHELAHELLHDAWSRMTLPGVVKEAEAETVAAVLLRWLGYDAPVSAAYLRNHGADADTVLGSLGRIRDCALSILEGIEEHEGAPLEIDCAS
jgi:hypothetical protein